MSFKSGPPKPECHIKYVGKFNYSTELIVCHVCNSCIFDITPIAPEIFFNKLSIWNFQLTVASIKIPSYLTFFSSQIALLRISKVNICEKL